MWTEFIQCVSVVGFRVCVSLDWIHRVCECGPDS